ncbi:MAG: maleylpyruvate isomerase N-terminal domain-containing protein [Nocardioidaceae bacterium]
MAGVVESWLVAAQSALTLLAEPVVAAAWEHDSALPGMSVGALSAHLAAQVVGVRDTILTPGRHSRDAPVPLLEHYHRSRWVQGGRDDPTNAVIRETAAAAAEPGHVSVLAAAQAALDEAAQLLAEEVEPAAVRLPGWEWSLTFEDYLVTRMMEITVHSDDLAVSLGEEPPLLPAMVLEPVLSLLVGLAVLRHGQAPVVRALSRAERAPASISAL